MRPDLPALAGAPEHIGGDDALADERAELVALLGAGPPLRMFSVQVTRAVSATTLICTSVRKNWMYSVFAMISAYERSTSPRPVSTGQPGCTQLTEVSSASSGSASSAYSTSSGASHRAVSSSNAPRSTAS